MSGERVAGGPKARQIDALLRENRDLRERAERAEAERSFWKERARVRELEGALEKLANAAEKWSVSVGHSLYRAHCVEEARAALTDTSEEDA